jgi:CheY-like chemotaxis protein
MHFGFYLVPLFAGVINLTLALFVLFINPRRRLNRVYCALGLGVAWWNLGVHIISTVDSPATALVVGKGIIMGVVLLPPLLYHFAVEVTGAKNNARTLIFLYCVALVFIGLNYGSLMVERIRPFLGSYRIVCGPGFYYYGAFFLAVGWGTITALIRFIRVSDPATTRSAKFLLVAVSILLLGGLHDMIPVLGWDFYPGTRLKIFSWGGAAVSLYGLIIGYSILSDQLFDVRISISRHSAMGLRLCFLAGIAFVLMLSIGTIFHGTFTLPGLFASLAVLVVSVAITAQFFPKLFGGAGVLLERRILGDHFEYQDKITEFIYSPQELDTLQRLLDDTTELVFRQLSLSAAGIAIISGDTKTRGMSMRGIKSEAHLENLVRQDSALVRYFRSTGVQIIDSKNDPIFGGEERSAIPLLTSASLELALSIGSRSKDPLGIMLIGPKRDGRPFAKSDVELLCALCRSLVFRVERIAIAQNEQLRQANNAKDRFLASINHEIRNPLNGITGLAQMLSETHTDPRSAFLITTLKACTEQLRSSMDDVLDFTQIESDAVTVVTTEVNLSELIRTTCSGNDVTGKLLVFSPVASDDILVQCDAGKVRQILSNYVANAIKYGAPPGAKVALLVDEIRPGTSHLRITVTSAGPALSQDEVGALFTALTRGQRARETNAHGTGLGLALSKKLAQAMGGSVGVKSCDGETTFWFEASFPTVSKSGASRTKDSGRYEGRRALAIEDEPYNRHVLEFYLKRFGIIAIWAEDGQRALEAAQNEVFDLILMDWLLPDMDGAELLQKIKVSRNTPLPPVIVLSAYSTTSKKAECLAAGAVAFISKPIDPEKLSVALDVCKLRPLSPRLDVPFG